MPPTITGPEPLPQTAIRDGLIIPVREGRARLIGSARSALGLRVAQGTGKFGETVSWRKLRLLLEATDEEAKFDSFLPRGIIPGICVEVPRRLPSMCQAYRRAVKSRLATLDGVPLATQPDLQRHRKESVCGSLAERFLCKVRSLPLRCSYGCQGPEMTFSDPLSGFMN